MNGEDTMEKETNKQNSNNGVHDHEIRYPAIASTGRAINVPKHDNYCDQSATAARGGFINSLKWYA